jgi:heme/copper-type cytochrome/quinol oxidase subunit 2
MSRKMLFLAVAVVLAVGAAAASTYLLYPHATPAATAPLPAWCVKPKGGYLIVANLDGYNDSKDHNVGVGNELGSWPVINVNKGANVTITVCNTDTQDHGFQVRYYYDSKIVGVAPGQSLTISFIADQKGSYAIYCGIFCTVHVYMQSGKLVVS